MSSRSRTEQRRKRGLQYAGVLRDTRIMPSERVPAVAHSETRSPSFSWRVVSGLIVLVLSGVLLLFYASDAFYIRSISVGGLRYLTREEVFRDADIANQHLFWLDPAQVRANLLRNASVADAQVWLAWPPQMVNIVIEEREPALVWEQNGQAVWVDIQGRMMVQREDRPDLVRIQANPDVLEGPLGEERQLAAEVVVGALQLQELLPNSTAFRYDRTRGLGFVNDYGWKVWFGRGGAMAEKLAIYTSITQSIVARGVQADEVNVANPDAPFYTISWSASP